MTDQRERGNYRHLSIEEPPEGSEELRLNSITESEHRLGTTEIEQRGQDSITERTAIWKKDGIKEKFQTRSLPLNKRQRLQHEEFLVKYFAWTKSALRLAIFGLSIMFSWLMFAWLWWHIANQHGDFEPDHLAENSGWKPCVVGLRDANTALLFSIENQHFIGFSSRYSTDECPRVIIVMYMQTLIGVLFQKGKFGMSTKKKWPSAQLPYTQFIGGQGINKRFHKALAVKLIIEKRDRPKTLHFSYNAVICLRDGFLSLMFRVGDKRNKSNLISSVRAYLIRPKTTQEGEDLSSYMYDLKLQVDDCKSQLFLTRPAVVVHRITENSPLYDMSAADLLRERFEVVVILEGTAESTKEKIQAKTSYLSSEILWGNRFENMVKYDFSLFHNPHKVETPLSSARELAEQRNATENNQQQTV